MQSLRVGCVGSHGANHPHLITELQEKPTGSRLHSPSGPSSWLVWPVSATCKDASWQGT